MSTNIWRGDAQPIAQVSTLTPVSVTNGNTVTITINRKEYTYTMGSSVAATELAALATALTTFGQTVLEFGEVTWTSSATALIGTGPDTGWPFTVTVSGTVSWTNVTTTSPSGPNWFSIAANWSTGVVPGDDDIVVFENSAVSCQHGLDQSSVTPRQIIIRSSFTGDIGLPRYNASNGYYEYRDTELSIGSVYDTDYEWLTIDMGEGDGSCSSLVRLNTNGKKTKLTVYNTGSSTENSVPALQWRGTHASNEVNALKGSLGIGFYAGQEATVATLRESYVSSLETDADVTVGADVTLTTVIKSGGTAEIRCAVTSVENSGGDLEIAGLGAVGSLVVTSGTAYCSTTGIVGGYGVITDISQADPAVVTSASHGLVAGDKVVLSDVVGMTEVNHVEFTVGEVTTDTFQLLATDSTGYTAYSSAGYWGKLNSIVVANTAAIDFSRSLEARQTAVRIDRYGDAAAVRDPAKRMTTLTSRNNQLAIYNHYTTADANLGTNYELIRQT